MSTITTNSTKQEPTLALSVDHKGAMDPHHILGVTKNARPALIKAAFAELASKYHPIHFLNPEQTHEILLEQSATLPSVDLADFIEQSGHGPTGYLFAGWATPCIEPVRREYDHWQAIVMRWNQIQRAYGVLRKKGGE